MKRFLVGFLAVVGSISILMFILFVVLIGYGLSNVQPSEPLPKTFVLEVGLDGSISEDQPFDPFARLFEAEVTPLREVVAAIDRARDDERVEGILAYAGGLGLGFTQMQDVRDAVVRFRESGKPAYIFAETYGEFSSGNGAYYLATAFDRIYLQPSGDVGLTGLYLEHPFVRGTLDKLGIVPRIEGRHEYKNAKNLYTETEFTDAHREASEGMVNSLFAQMVEAIAESRKMTPESVRSLIDRGPFLGDEAVDAGLVDGLAYVDEVWDALDEEFDYSPDFVSLDHYIEREEPFWKGRDKIALIYAEGQIVRGPSEYDGLSGESSLGAATLSEAFRSATEDPFVRAIAFRVNCPGGSYVASDVVRREVARAREAGIPVVVSMGDYAASGGYFISMGADKILAQPGTLTGSIGVYGGKLIVRGLADKLGVSFDTIQTNRHADIWSMNQDYSPSEAARIDAFLDRVYEDFTTKVAEHRELPLERVREVARGRVWTGAQAIEHGLVDEIGGLHEALAAAADLAEVTRYRLQVYPEKESAWDVVAKRGGLGMGSSPRMRAAAGVLAEMRPLVALAEALGLLERQGDAVLLDPSLRRVHIR